MPKMPVYNSQGSLNTGLSAPIREGSAQEATATAPIIEAASQINTKWNEAIDNMQETAVKYKYETAQAQAESNALNDENINGEQTQIDFLKKASDEALKNVTNAQLRDKLKFQLDYANTIASIKINGIYAKKKIFTDNMNTEGLLDQYSQNRSPENDAKAMSLIQTKVSKGFYTPEQGKALIEKYKKTSAQYDIYNDPSTDEKDSTVLAELKKGENGQYKDLSSQDRLSLIKESQSRIFQNNQSVKRNMSDLSDKNTADLWTKAINKTLTFKDLDEAMALPEDQGGVSRSRIDSFQKGLEAQYKSDLERVSQDNAEATNYIDLVNTYLQGNDRKKAYEILGRMYSDGVLSPSEAKTLLPLKDILTNMQAREKWLPIKHPIGAIHAFFSKNFPKDQTTLAVNLKQFFNEVDSGKDPTTSSQTIIQQARLQKYPWMANLPKEGETRICPDGVSRRFYPDGRIEDVK